MSAGQLEQVKQLERLLRQNPKSPKAASWHKELKGIRKNVANEESSAQIEKTRKKAREDALQHTRLPYLKTLKDKFPHEYSKYLAYLYMLYDPSDNMVRCPDSSTFACGLFHGRQTHKVVLDFGSSNGDFSIFVQPKIGSLLNTSGLNANGDFALTPAISISKPTFNSDSYDLSQDFLYYNDEEGTTLFNSFASRCIHIAEANALPTLFSGYLMNGNNFQLDDKFNCAVQYIDLTAEIPIPNPTVGPGWPTDVLQKIVPSFGATTNITNQCLTGVSGWYDVSPIFVVENGSVNNSVGQSAAILLEMDKQNQVTGYVLDHGGAFDSMYGNFTSNDKFQSGNNLLSIGNSLDWVGQIYNPNQSVFFSINWRINFDPTKKYVIACSTGIATINSVKVGFAMHSVGGNTKAYKPGVGNQPIISTLSEYTYSGTVGLAQSIRPVACAALLMNVTPQIYQGGTLATASLPTGTSHLWVENSANSPIQSLDGLRALNIENRVTCNPASKGGYAIWIPNEPSARDYKSFTDHNAFDYGGLCFSGSLPTQSGVTTICFELLVDTVFEYTTASRLLDTRICKGDPAIFTAALNNVETNLMVCENPEHLEKIKQAVISGLFPMSNFFSGSPTSKVMQSLNFGAKVGKKVMDGNYSEMVSSLVGLM